MRHAEIGDLPRIIEIYNASIPSRQATADTDPITVDSRIEWFNGHNKLTRPILVHEEEGQIIAWISFESFYGRPAYKHTAEVSIYIDPDFCGKGLGSRMLAYAVDFAPLARIKTLVAYIFAHNEPSIRLFKAHGFETWGELPNIAEMDEVEYSLMILGRRVELSE